VGDELFHAGKGWTHDEADSRLSKCWERAYSLTYVAPLRHRDGEEDADWS